MPVLGMKIKQKKAVIRLFVKIILSITAVIALDETVSLI